ncbi:alcohol dehydrogenase catalytic domain-containing protein [Streptomyces longwoodensis]|uniref:alcohol dehydrogenase catalytic domain-containing protein n=1 Tax=Streptomyces longwoodensis TaxID=68231 RepID=UPI0033B8D8F2
MKAVVATAPGPNRVALLDVKEVTCRPGHVVVRVEAVGICGSEIHIQQGDVSWDMTYPVTLGHEFSGVVVEAGPGVTSFTMGDRVVSETAAHIDAASEWARTGVYNLDPHRRGFGARADGGMAERVVVPERCLHRLPDNVSFKQGALTEPVCVAYQATCVRTEIRPGDAVAVVGAGTIGLLSAWLATRGGADPVVVVGLPGDAWRAATMQAMGPIRFAESVEEARTALERRGRAGADAVIDAAGASEALRTAVELARPLGQVTKVGWGPQPYAHSLDPLVAKQLTLRGSFSHTWAVWERVLGLLADGAGEVVERIVGWEGTLDDWATGFELQAEGAVIKGMLLPRSCPAG